MSKLAGKVAVIAGGAGEVGEGIVKAFLTDGATVVVPSRSQEKLNQLHRRLDTIAVERLVTLVADIGTVEGAEKLRDDVAGKVGAIDAVVASLGGWWQGEKLVDISLELWHRLIDNSLTAHFIFARTFLPVVVGRAGGSYTLINGGAGLNPVPTAGPISISAAGQLMLKDVLAAESKDSPVRINALVLGTPIITRSRPEGPDGWLTADEAGRYAAYLASDEAAKVSGETVVFSDRSQLNVLS